MVSKSNDDEQDIWESGAGSSFTVQKDTEFDYGEIKRGTKVICYLKQDQSELLEGRRLEDLVKQHSHFIGIFSEPYVEKSNEKEATDSEDEEEIMTRVVKRVMSPISRRWTRRGERGK